MGLVMGPDNITSASCHCNNTLRFSISFFFINHTLQQMLMICVCVCVCEMMIINIYCLHIVVYDDSSGSICIFLIFSHTKEIGLLH